MEWFLTLPKYKTMLITVGQKYIGDKISGFTVLCKYNLYLTRQEITYKHT